MKRDEIKHNFEQMAKRLGIGLDQVVRAANERLKLDEEYRKEIVALLDYLEEAIGGVRESIENAEFEGRKFTEETGSEWDDEWDDEWADEEEL